jgi:hypothetical protein
MEHEPAAEAPSSARQARANDFGARRTLVMEYTSVRISALRCGALIDELVGD